MTSRTRRKTFSAMWRNQQSHLGWYNRLARVVGAAGIAVLSGWLMTILMPRGPVTSSQVLILMVTGLVVGVLAGAAWRSRWAFWVVPILHIGVFELGRVGAVGPTVDGIRFDTVYGVIAFVLGRGLYGLIGLTPMLLGMVYGKAFALRLSAKARAPTKRHRRIWVYTRWTVVFLATAVFVGVALLFTRPASTPPILGTDGQPLPRSIASLERVSLGAQDQWIMTRGANTDNPVLLYLSGGPGQSDLPFSRVLLGEVEKDLVVVSWDQRGTGKSYPALEPTSALTLQRAVSDTIELTNYLREKFGERKIYLLGESWGTLLGVLAVQRQPELYHAFVGSGQMVDVLETDRRLYRDVLALAQEQNDTRLQNKMLAVGEPPYGDVFASSIVFGQYDKLYQPYTPPQSYRDLGATSGAEIGPWGVFAQEYTPIEKINVLRGLLDTFSVMYPQIQDIDLRRDAPELEVPVYILDGKAELTARRDLALEWFGALRAPSKQMISFKNAAHSVAFEQFRAFHQLMTDTIVPETYSRR